MGRHAMGEAKRKSGTIKDADKGELVCAIKEWFRYVEGGYVEKRNSRGVWVQLPEFSSEKGHRVTATCRCADSSVNLRVHQIVFALHHGYIPKIIDHIDQCPNNNDISNLRDATASTNARNKRTREGKLLGVRFKRGKFVTPHCRFSNCAIYHTDYEAAVFHRLVIEVLYGYHHIVMNTGALHHIRSFNYSQQDIHSMVRSCDSRLFTDALGAYDIEETAECVFKVLNGQPCTVGKKLNLEKFSEEEKLTLYLLMQKSSE